MTTAIDAGQRQQVVHQAASLLLSYPDEALLERLPLLRQALAEADALAWFEPVIAHLEGTELVAAQAFHVAEFDTSRRHALHLSYWTDGDTRRRGEVLGSFKQAYRDSGLLVDLAGELPDHLPMVLEFAVHDPERGRALLQEYRASLELLRLQLEKDELPHAGILQAVCALLPGESPSSRAEVQAMYDARVQHTQVELVGLDGLPGYANASSTLAGGEAPEVAATPAPELLGVPGLRPGAQAPTHATATSGLGVASPIPAQPKDEPVEASFTRRRRFLNPPFRRHHQEK